MTGYPKLFDGKGTKEEPFLVPPYDFDNIRHILSVGDAEYDQASEFGKRAVKATFRHELLERYPQLFDHAYLKEVM